jgi:hypothetical protein
MEDLLVGRETKGEVPVLARNLMKVLREYGFRLCKFLSYSQTVFKGISPKERAQNANS